MNNQPIKSHLARPHSIRRSFIIVLLLSVLLLANTPRPTHSVQTYPAAGCIQCLR